MLLEVRPDQRRSILSQNASWQVSTTCKTPLFYLSRGIEHFYLHVRLKRRGEHLMCCRKPQFFLHEGVWKRKCTNMPMVTVFLRKDNSAYSGHFLGIDHERLPRFLVEICVPGQGHSPYSIPPPAGTTSKEQDVFSSRFGIYAPSNQRLEEVSTKRSNKVGMKVLLCAGSTSRHLPTHKMRRCCQGLAYQKEKFEAHSATTAAAT